MKKFWGFLSFLLLISCNEKPVADRNIFADFDVTVELSDPVTVVENLLNPDDLSICNSFMLFRENSDSTTVALFDTSGNHIINFLWKGRGPGETINTLDVSFYNDEIIQASVHPESVFLYDVKQLLSGVKMPDKVLSLDQGEYASSTIIRCAEDVLFYVGKDINNEVNNTRFCFRNMQDDALYPFGEYPEEDINIADFPQEDYSKQTAYQGRPVLKPDHTKIVVPYYYAVGFDIIDMNKRAVEYSNFYQYPGVECTYIPQIKASVVKRNPEKYRGFLDACCSDKSIYFLFSSKRMKDSSNAMGRYVLKYNWDGKSECCYVLDREIFSIAIDKDEQHLYVCSHDIEGGTIDRYLL